MARVVFRKGEQRRFIERVEKVTGLSSEGLGELVGISGRSLRDWRSENLLGFQKVLLKLSDFSGISLPKILEIRPEYWSVHKAARKGAYARLKIYGPLGTFESCRKGGLVAQQRRRENPEKYRALGCSLRKKVACPSHSPELAEAFGILLGDGGISSRQVYITLNAIADKKYAVFVESLFKKLFKIEVRRYKRSRGDNTIILAMSATNLVEFLVQKGLSVGNKVKQQVGVPGWISANRSYGIACVRGLMDTDGGIFNHRYKVNGKKYSYKKLCFGNRSVPILNFVKNELENLGFNPKMRENRHVWLYNEKEVKAYLEKVGTHNQRLRRKLGN